MVVRVRDGNDARTINVIAVRDGSVKRDIKVARVKDNNGVVHTVFARAGGQVNSNRFNFTAGNANPPGQTPVIGYGAYAATGNRSAPDEPTTILDNINRFYQVQDSSTNAPIWANIRSSFLTGLSNIYATITQVNPSATLDVTLSVRSGTSFFPPQDPNFRACGSSPNPPEFMQDGNDYYVEFFSDSARTTPLNIGTRPIPLPTIATFDLQPEYLLDSTLGNITVSWNITGSTSSNLLIHPATAAGTTHPITPPIGASSTSVPSGTENIEFVINAANSAGDVTQERRNFYRVLSPTVSVSDLGTVSYPIFTGGVALQRVVKTIRITRSGSPLPTLSLASTGSPANRRSSLTQSPNRDPDATVIDYMIQRNISPGDAAFTEPITVVGSTRIPVSGFTTLTDAASVTLNWAAG